MPASNFASAIGQGLNFANQQEQQKLARQQQFMQLDNARKGALFQDARVVNSLLNSGQTDQALNFLGQRVNLLNQVGGDPTDTMEIVELINSGNLDQAKSLLSSVEQAGVQSGFLKDIELEKQKISGREAKTAEEKNFEKLAEIEKKGTPEQVATFRKLLNLQDDPKLSSRAEKAIIDAQDSYFKSGEQARKMELLASDIQRLDIGGGMASTVTETFKDILGSQDEVTSLRKRFNAIRSSQATSNLPPGPASDKDIALALSGFPKENANANQITSFLRGQAKLERINEKFQEFKAEYIGQRKKPSGLIKAWKQQINQEGFLDDVLKPKDPIKNISEIDVSELSDEDLFN